MNLTGKMLALMLAAGTLPLINIGCAGFGTSRQRQLAKGAKTRIAIVGCGDWVGRSSTALDSSAGANSLRSAIQTRRQWV